MADKPILFSTPMVRALIAGTKTQTRRIITPQPPSEFDKFAGYVGMGCTKAVFTDGNKATFQSKLRVQSGDRLYVREAWRVSSALNNEPPRDIGDDTIVEYIADGGTRLYGKHRQAMHMPRWASRITLLVDGVEIERLRDIRRDDAVAEGLIKIPFAPFKAAEFDCDWGFEGDKRHGSPISAYAALWDAINGDGAWNANPWVVAYTFRVVMGNIDRIAEAA